jgi:hypothetical protein
MAAELFAREKSNNSFRTKHVYEFTIKHKHLKKIFIDPLTTTSKLATVLGNVMQLL